MGDHAHVCFIVKIILNLIMKWVVGYMRYTLVFIVVSIGIIEFFQLVSILTFFCILIFLLCMYAFNWYHLLWLVLVLFHTHIHVYLCLLYPYVFKHETLFILILSFNFVSIDLIFNWYLISSLSIFLFGIS